VTARSGVFASVSDWRRIDNDAAGGTGSRPFGVIPLLDGLDTYVVLLD
jgi:hypothetical protein